MYQVWKDLRMYFKVKQYGCLPMLFTLPPDLMAKVMLIERRKAEYRRERRLIEFRDKLREMNEALENYRKRVGS